MTAVANSENTKTPAWQYAVGIAFWVAVAGYFFGGSDAETARDGTQCFSAWDGSVDGLVTHVKGTLREPGSFEHVETRYGTNNPDFLTVQMTYRAKNGFGGVNVEKAYARVDRQSCSVLMAR